MIEQLGAVRRDRDRVATQLRLAESLRKLAGHLERGELACDPDAYAIVLVGASDAAVEWKGALDTWNEVRDLSSVLDAAVWAGRTGQPIQEAAAERLRRQRYVRARALQDEAARRDELPWACEFCDRRYKTKVGAERHEDLYCWHNPRSARFAPRGEYVPRMRDGKVQGFLHVSIAEEHDRDGVDAPSESVTPPP
jgi:hypothetical protein